MQGDFSSTEETGKGGRNGFSVSIAEIRQQELFWKSSSQIKNVMSASKTYLLHSLAAHL